MLYYDKTISGPPEKHVLSLMELNSNDEADSEGTDEGSEWDMNMNNGEYMCLWTIDDTSGTKAN